MFKNLLTLVLLFSVTLANATCLQNTHSLNLTGTSYVNFTTNTNLNMTSAITVEAWINAAGWGANSFSNSIVCHHSSTNGGSKGFVLRAGGSGQLSFAIAGDSAGVIAWKEIISGTNTLTLNTWTHVAATFDGTMMRIYVNGLSVGQKAFNGTIHADTVYNMKIGRWSDNNMATTQPRYWNGKIDEVRIWNRACAAPELQSKRLTHIDPAQETGLVGYWRFNEGLGSTVNDLATSGNNGTLTGAYFVTQVPFTQNAATPTIMPNGNTLTSSVATAYQWNLNGAPISGATSQVWQVVAIGSYTVTVTDANGCTGTSAPYFIATVGVNELSDGSILDVKQTVSSIDISLQNSTGIKSVTLFDLNGRQVYRNDVIGAEQLSISKESLTNGIYILEVNTNSCAKKVKIYIH